MALGGCYTCLKYLMFVFNFIFWLIGCALLAVGIWVKVSEKSFGDVIKDQEVAASLSKDWSPWVIIVLGAIILILGFLGCCGAIRENQCMLATFFVLLFIIFAVLLTVGILAYVMFDKKEAEIEEKLVDIIQKDVNVYQNDTNAKATLKKLHEEFDCCGSVKGEFANLHGPVNATEACGSDYATKEGCAKKIIELTKAGVVIIVAVTLAVAVIILLGMIFSMLLCCAIREAA